MYVACFDLEGVLVPEIWVGLAERTGIDGLRLTTREVADYDQLMRHRLKLLDEHGLGLADIRAAADALEPLPGAVEFLDWVRARCQVAILSDTFYELAEPLVAELGRPMLICHTLVVDGSGRVTGWRLRQRHPKRRAVAAFQSLNFKVVAVGDSYNDTRMLARADIGILFCPPDNVVEEFPAFPVCRSYDELRAAIETAMDGWSEALRAAG